VILFLHNRYRTTGGEERVVADLQWLVREQLGEDAELLSRDSASLDRVSAARGLLAGGLDPEEVGRAVRRTRARVVHAHNLHPTLGWRALRAARDAGARVVLHLHNYRLVCAVGTCFSSRGEDCTRCRGLDTRPGVRLNCRGTGGAEAAVYGAGVAVQQRRLTAHADAIVVPSQAAAARLRELHAPVDPHRLHVVPHVVRSFATRSSAAGGTYALVASRLAPEKGVDTAIEACARAGLPLRIAGDGPSGDELRARAAAFGGGGGARGPGGPGEITFLGRLDDAALARQRAGAALAIVASRAAETFGLAAAEAMAAGLPVAATRVGALPDLLDPAALSAPGDVEGLARTARELFADEATGLRNLGVVRERCAPAHVARALNEVYGGT
jgi:glycosyltransferase involved in cell wall biosynthesis